MASKLEENLGWATGPLPYPQLSGFSYFVTGLLAIDFMPWSFPAALILFSSPDALEMDRCSSEQKSEDHVGFGNAGFASEWQLRHPSRGSSTPSMPGSFTASLWNPSMAEADLPAVNKQPPHLGMAWNHPSSDSLSAGASFLPPNVYHFASDSAAFIKRAARFSSFNPYSKIDINMSESGKEDGSLPGSPMVEQDKAALQEGTGASSSKALAAKKRKRSSEKLEDDQTKGDPTMATGIKENVDTNQKPDGKQEEAAKEDYIHVRARRGQATNSHSLAERVRREKISQRMKFLQELVPGCSKVTGKAVMLDEIINYVQSLQRQVEFLSMKLATVNPRMDFNMDPLLSKDFLQSHSGPSSAIGFSPDMVHAQMHPSQQGLMQSALSASLNSTPNANTFRRAMNSQLNSLPNVWDEQLQNVMQMTSFSNNPQQPRTE
ncbi:hypothetical protein ZIOFF_040488 [Zingiber officinale]|uniref:BHLH domain-containing protein n=2 Tax=Zingiber officinale TaxID=94328 RepID=A0A8J5G5A4_ZINOF|nr:hypothetical protein ZIOFF_040488 [Zingiber officinale]